MDRHDIAGRQCSSRTRPTRRPAAAAPPPRSHALRQVFGPDADAVVIANTKGFTGHAMGVGIEDVVAIKALETGIVPPVPNFKEPDPELGQLNLSTGGSYPVRYALRLAAGFGSQIAMMLLRWTPVPDGRHRLPDELGYEYRIVDRAAWRRWLAQAAGTADAAARGRAAPAASRRHRPAGDSCAVAGPGASSDGPAAQVAARPRPRTAAVPTPGVPRRRAGRVGDDVTGTVVGIVAEQTGYPPDLLDLDLDLEADLGVDTVKQAEVFAAIREHYGVERDDSLKLRDFPTLTHVVGWIRDKTGAPAPGDGRRAPPAADAPARRGGGGAVPVMR